MQHEVKISPIVSCCSYTVLLYYLKLQFAYWIDSKQAMVHVGSEYTSSDRQGHCRLLLWLCALLKNSYIATNANIKQCVQKLKPL